MNLLFVLAVVAFGSGAWAQVPPLKCTQVQRSNHQCAVRASLTENGQYGFPLAAPVPVNSLEECASICEGRRYSVSNQQLNYGNWCKAFYYDSGEGLCRIGNAAKRWIRANESSTKVFYNHRCFSCGPICNQPYDQQLLYNGGFEAQPVGPWFTSPQSGSAPGTIGAGYKSSSSFQANPGASIAQNYNSCDDYMYKVTFDYKIIRSGNYTPEFTTYTGSYSYTDRTPSGTSGQWRSITGFFNNQGGFRGYVQFDCGPNNFMFPGPSTPGNNTYNVDNVEVTRVPNNPETKPLTEPAFENAGFETGDLAPWTLTVTRRKKVPHSIVSPGLNGSKYALFVDLTDQDAYYFILRQVVKGQAGKNYLVKFDYSIPTDTDGPIEVSIAYRAGARRASAGISPFSLQLNPGTGTFSTPIGVQAANEALWRFQFYPSAFFHTNITLDNFRLEEIV